MRLRYYTARLHHLLDKLAGNLSHSCSQKAVMALPGVVLDHPPCSPAEHEPLLALRQMSSRVMECAGASAD